jgi:hypothetical protein
VPLCPPQIPHDLAWDRTRAAAVESQRLTAWAMARPTYTCKWSVLINLHATYLFSKRPSHSICHTPIGGASYPHCTRVRLYVYQRSVLFTQQAAEEGDSALEIEHGYQLY